ncbi:MAG: rRNA maturation RNase YbeY [Alphaproteobacteria bacterium]|nr:rRNA maturation RNase YbeY [Alphaproteobacteria bacterium]
MPNFSIQIIQFEKKWAKSIPNLITTTRHIAAMTLEKIYGHKKTGMIGIVFVNDKKIHQLNYQFRGINKPTNVLAFEAMQDGMDLVMEKKELGEVILAYETTMREARAQNKSFEHHFSHLLVHGILHICGYDHMNDKDAKIMEKLEIKILKQMNIPNPY